MRRDRLLIALAVFGLNSAVVEGQAQPATTNSAGTTQFQQSIERQRDGRIRLKLLVRPGLAQDSIMFGRQTQVIAERVATRECHRGHDFYAVEPFNVRRSEFTFVFKCR
jgi:hypothetical protein